VDQSVPGGTTHEGDDQWLPPAVGARRRRRRWLPTVLLVAVAVMLAGTFWKLPYYTFSPGSMRATQPLVVVDGTTTYPDDTGEIGYLTVRFSQATPFGLVRGWVDSDIEVLGEAQALGGLNRDDNRRVQEQLMLNAKDTATVVALEYLGYDVELLGTGAVVVAISEGSAAAEVLDEGDVVVAIDGTPVTTTPEVVERIATYAPGDTVTLTVERHSTDPVVAPVESASAGGVPPVEPADEPAGEPVIEPVIEQVSATLGAWPDEPDRPLLGVTTVTRDQEFNLPFAIDIDSGNVIGPSAGLAFTLAIIDVLTPGDLTGGQVVGVTGTIAPSGAVGRVGGVGQKAAAAIGAGATLYLVPTDEADEARQRAGSAMEVVPVETLDDALAALAQRGGRPVERP